MISLKDLLFEDEVDDIFGNVAFGSKSDIASYQNKQKEENTRLEDLILSKLRWWTSDYQSMRVSVSSEIYSYEKLFRRAQTKFPSIFKPKTPNGTTLYRGLSMISTKMMTKLRQKNFEDYDPLNIQSDSYWLYRGKVSYYPENDLQSWTSNQKIAHKFSMDGISKDMRFYGCILITKQNNEFLFNQDFMNLLQSNEDEIIHFGKSYRNKIQICIHDTIFQKLYGSQLIDFYRRKGKRL